MLGNMMHFFMHVSIAFDPNDEFAVYLKTELDKVFDLQQSDVLNAISSANCQKYRNPPAHTGYLPYSIARECKTFVEDALLRIFDSIH